MIDLRKKALDMLFTLKAQGVDKAECTVTYITIDETNSLGHEEYLLREHETTDMEIKLYKGNRLAQITVNQFSPEALNSAAGRAVAMAECSPEVDEQKLSYTGRIRSDTFINTPRDPEKLYSRFEEMMSAVKRDYPNIAMDGIAEWSETKVLYLNTDGQELSFTNQNAFSGWQAGARNQTSTTDCVFSFAPIEGYDMPYLDIGDMREKLTLAERMLDPKKLSGETFEGTLVLTPDAVGSYAWQIIERINKMENNDGLPSPDCSSSVNMYEVFSDTKYKKGDGPYNSPAAKVRYIVRNGITQPKETAGMSDDEEARFLAQKARDTKGLNINITGIEPGNTPLAELIKGVERGLLVGYINGSMPSPNGDFSGAAKNSFYIENGEIRHPVVETMVMGNVFDLFKHVEGISVETEVNNGANYPWIAVGGATIR